jgi:hypothetical protein
MIRLYTKRIRNDFAPNDYTCAHVNTFHDDVIISLPNNNNELKPWTFCNFGGILNHSPRARKQAIETQILWT